MNGGTPGISPLLTLTHWLMLAAPYLTAMSLLIGICWALAARRRADHVKSALSGRVTVEVVPASTFDPSEAVVGRWAQQLARIRFAASATPARGAGARLRYSAREGKMHCYVEGPQAASAILTMPGFPDVEVRTVQHRRALRPVRFATTDQEGKA